MINLTFHLVTKFLQIVNVVSIYCCARLIYKWSIRAKGKYVTRLHYKTRICDTLIYIFRHDKENLKTFRLEKWVLLTYITNYIENYKANT